MEQRPVYLTTKRLLYNIARVDFRYERISEDYVNRRKLDWELEFSDVNYEKKHGPKKY